MLIRPGAEQKRTQQTKWYGLPGNTVVNQEVASGERTGDVIVKHFALPDCAFFIFIY